MSAPERREGKTGLDPIMAITFEFLISSICDATKPYAFPFANQH